MTRMKTMFAIAVRAGFLPVAERSVK